ncbi:hypothetical protein H8B15_06420 [Hymenobacter sp. BT507]|uniref:DUF6602 domain-containing protein n=1 Tax=Hymenobacter citatus TaxID=2763506 RepID=A0ABR7MHX8_9BACT|nr:DUF6602 domain-containing protein [Hymenobacter citatus]MBC6610548.1 hypothetical protein [Hymenobacter citatus]
MATEILPTLLTDMVKMNNNIEQYLIKQSQILNHEFEKIKSIYGDSDVKGGQNEKIIADFIKENYNSNFNSIGVEIIDSFGNRTDEIDICINNQYQPFSAKYGQPLIAEGVDFVIQVKKTITSQEIPRIVKNCERLKMLKRKPSNGDKFYGEIEDAEYFLERIPYIVVAVDSQLTLDTVANNLANNYKYINFYSQPDAIFVLNRGFIINFREGKGRAWTTEDGKKLIGFCVVHSADKTLFELVRYIHSYIPKTEKLTHPLNNYYPTRINYKINGLIE